MRKELIVFQDPKSPISEVFKTLRTNIQFMNNKKKLQTLLVTSTLPGEGKSWVSSNLAVTFAQTGKKVILIDADMRKGRQYSIFGLSPRPGLSNYLSGIDDNLNEVQKIDIADYIQETEVDNLYLMSAGNIPPNPSELLVSEAMEELLNELKQLCDIVIIDGPPSQLVTDSLIISRIVDSTVIVTAHKQTKKDSLQRIIDNIQNIGGKIAGVVVNKIPVSAKKYEETYYYGSTSLKPSNNINMQKRNMTSSRTIKSNRAKEINNQIKTSENIDIETKSKKVISKIEEEIPKALKKEHIEEISLDKTNDILKQINEYLDEEKKKID